ncbi:NADPH-dependent FMN reductase [Phlyctema vagabunda]|uniref:NADPH-dependent FMN reductase n=1 Tax=Phlyctema vagabunda TaxID=108571 RepID=A0ABR4PQ78_9HELO
MTALKRVALLICSTRTPRAGPSISSWLSTQLPPVRGVSLSTIDLTDHISQLPVSPNDRLMPSQQPRANPRYSDPGVQRWSDRIASFDAFIFLTPQYNWSFPAAVKVAIDHLFYEWAGKPSFIVSYGGRGGGKAALALREVFRGLKMHSWEGQVELPLGGGVPSAAQGRLDEEVVKRWEETGKPEEISKVWTELVDILSPTS